MRCIYSAVRFVPDPGRGEFINVGVLVGSEQTGACRLSVVRNRRRASSIDVSGVFDLFWDYLLNLKKRLESEDEFRFSERWLEETFQESRNLLQLSQPMPIRAKTVGVALKAVRERILVDQPNVIRSKRFTKRSAVKQLRIEYEKVGLEPNKHFMYKPVVRGPNHAEEFDFAVANGSAVQLTQAWNFRKKHLRLLREEVKAWAWTVRDIRASGGTAEVDGKHYAVDKDIPVEVVYIEPQKVDEKNALAEAAHAFSEVNARAVALVEVSEVAERAAALL